MADSSPAPAPALAPAPAPAAEASALVLVVAILGSQQAVEDVVTGLLDLGMGGTLLESKGLAALLREEMPIFSGLAALLPEASRTRTIMSVTTREKAAALLKVVEATAERTQRAVAFVVPVESAVAPRL